MRDVRRFSGGCGLCGIQVKEWMGCFLDDPRAFGINADQWTTAAQDEGEWRRTAEHFMAKWIGQGSTTACSVSRMSERGGKDQGKDSPKQADSYWFARSCWLATSGANLYPPGVWFADPMTSFSGVSFRHASVEDSALRSIALRYAGAPIAHVFLSFFFLFIWRRRSFEYFLNHCRFLLV